MSVRSGRKQYIEAPDQRLSIPRALIGGLIMIGLVVASYFGTKQVQAYRSTTSSRTPWFAAYVDVTATPTYPFDQMGASADRDAVLSFIVAQPGNGCTPTWGSAYTMDQADAALDLDRRIARLQQQGGSVAVSFGGRDNNELAVGCTDPNALYSAYKSVIDRYHINTIDLDIEGSDLTNGAAGARRATAIAKLQRVQRASGRALAVWMTLPATTQGLSDEGANAVAQLLAAHVDLAGVNVMTMDYGASLGKGQTMLTGSESALTQTARQLGILYDRSGTHLNARDLWAKIGATPMIGQNDIASEVFTMADAAGLNTFARAHGVGRMSMWSENRDITCGSNYVDTTVVSTSCSGVAEGTSTYAGVLSRGFAGDIDLSAGLVTKADPLAALTPDNPATSPYQIWSPSDAYLEGTKVTWHHNVYEAKWWTQGDMPDDPVLQSYQTPWQLIGPVLPGEKPIPQPTLPAGTYPDWSGTTIYNEGQRVLFNGVPYQAKWWNQGASPAAASSNPDGSPWTPLTQAQVNEIEAAN